MANDANSVEKALRILKAFCIEQPHFQFTELVKESGFNKTTVHRLLKILENEGFVVRDVGGKYLLGPQMHMLSLVNKVEESIEKKVRPILFDLVEKSGETASFLVREGDMEVCQFCQNSRKALRHHMEEGERFSLKNGLSANMLLAFTGDDEESGSLTKQSYGFSMGNRDPNLASVAVPVLQGSLCLGVLVISGINARFTPRFQKMCVQWLQTAAKKIW